MGSFPGSCVSSNLTFSSHRAYFRNVHHFTTPSCEHWDNQFSKRSKMFTKLMLSFVYFLCQQFFIDGRGRRGVEVFKNGAFPYHTFYFYLVQRWYEYKQTQTLNKFFLRRLFKDVTVVSDDYEQHL